MGSGLSLIRRTAQVGTTTPDTPTTPSTPDSPDNTGTFDDTSCATSVIECDNSADYTVVEEIGEDGHFVPGSLEQVDEAEIASNEPERGSQSATAVATVPERNWYYHREPSTEELCMTRWLSRGGLKVDYIPDIKFSTPGCQWKPTGLGEIANITGVLQKMFPLCKAWCETTTKLNIKTMTMSPWKELLAYGWPPVWVNDSLSTAAEAMRRATWCRREVDRYHLYMEAYKCMAMSLIQHFLANDLMYLSAEAARLVAATICAAGHGDLGCKVIQGPDWLTDLELFECVWIWPIAIQEAGKTLQAQLLKGHNARNVRLGYELPFTPDLTHWKHMREVVRFMHRESLGE